MATERKIRIIAGPVQAEATLNESPTATSIWNALPIEARGNTWGDEIYFSIPVNAKQEKDARDLVAVGELGYWAPGTAFCIFFGRTPASTDDRPRAASPVNIIGTVSGDATVFRKVSSGTKVTLERA
ncbi:MAG TPA: cyclophilin-like fold protein [Candidatus Baltobacteraceae bacterium]|nr:cyclophilin-like fold protein [Candidatus Baltobacteraceae bacterium]